MFASASTSVNKTCRKEWKVERMTALAKVRFYATYLFAKVVLVWFEVRKPKFELFLFEVLYSIGRFWKAPIPNHPKLFRSEYVSTINGEFRIRPNTMDMTLVSPAFERADMKHMIGLTTKLAQQGKRVLVLDIGGDFGCYTVPVGRALKATGGEFRIEAFEPASSSNELLHENVRRNGLEDFVTVHQFAVWDKDGETLELQFSQDRPGSSGIGTDDERTNVVIEQVQTQRLDTVLKGRDDFDVIVAKIDVEGAEQRVLEGAGDLLARVDSYVMVEDFVDESIIEWLRNSGAAPGPKLTTYNSWWLFQQARMQKRATNVADITNR